MTDTPTPRPDWPIAVYAAVEGSIPGEPFVAYPLIPDGKRGVRAISRFSGPSLSEARAAAQSWADEINAILSTRIARVFAIVIEKRTTHDGRIPVARVVNAAGSVAAALMVVIGGAYAVGLGSVLS